MEAITLYKQVLKSNQHFFTYKWRLEEFLKRGFRNFLPESEPLQRYYGAGHSQGTGGTTPPVSPVSPALRSTLLERRKALLEDNND